MQLVLYALCSLAASLCIYQLVRLIHPREWCSEQGSSIPSYHSQGTRNLWLWSVGIAQVSSSLAASTLDKLLKLINMQMFNVKKIKRATMIISDKEY